MDWLPSERRNASSAFLFIGFRISRQTAYPIRELLYGHTRGDRQMQAVAAVSAADVENPHQHSPVVEENLDRTFLSDNNPCVAVVRATQQDAKAACPVDVGWYGFCCGYPAADSAIDACRISFGRPGPGRRVCTRDRNNCTPSAGRLCRTACCRAVVGWGIVFV